MAPYERTLRPNGNLSRRALLGSATAAAFLAALPKKRERARKNGSRVLAF